jgi:hypothetical protein
VARQSEINQTEAMKISKLKAMLTTVMLTPVVLASAQAIQPKPNQRNP